MSGTSTELAAARSRLPDLDASTWRVVLQTLTLSEWTCAAGIARQRGYLISTTFYMARKLNLAGCSPRSACTMQALPAIDLYLDEGRKHMYVYPGHGIML